MQAPHLQSLSNPTDRQTHNIRNLKKVVFRHKISLDGANAISAQEISLDDSLVDNDDVSVEGQDSETEEYSVDRIIGKKFINCGWRGYEREEKEGEREVDNLSTCGCVIQLYLWENTRFIEIREFGWGFLMLTS